MRKHSAQQQVLITSLLCLSEPVHSVLELQMFLSRCCYRADRTLQLVDEAQMLGCKRSLNCTLFAETGHAKVNKVSSVLLGSAAEGLNACLLQWCAAATKFCKQPGNKLAGLLLMSLMRGWGSQLSELGCMLQSIHYFPYFVGPVQLPVHDYLSHTGAALKPGTG